MLTEEPVSSNILLQISDRKSSSLQLSLLSYTQNFLIITSTVKIQLATQSFAPWQKSMWTYMITDSKSQPPTIELEIPWEQQLLSASLPYL